MLEHAERGSLMQIVKENRLSVPQVRTLFYQLCQAVDYLHCNYIVHRDLKLENVFVAVDDDRLTCKLGDFGFAAACKSSD